jgi:hypothetical protein
VAKRVTKGNLWGFIQSRPYASVADIRRLFMMDVEGAAALATNEGPYYIGLPPEAADLIRQLWQDGRILLDLNPDVKGKVVQGVYPARMPMARGGGASGSSGGAVNGSARGAKATAPSRPPGAGAAPRTGGGQGSPRPPAPPAGPASPRAAGATGGAGEAVTGASRSLAPVAGAGTLGGTPSSNRRRRRRKRRAGGADADPGGQEASDRPDGVGDTAALLATAADSD